MKTVKKRNRRRSAPYKLAPYYAAVDAASREVLEAALVEHAGNRTKAAEALGISRPYMLRLMEKLGVKEEPPDRALQLSIIAALADVRTAMRASLIGRRWNLVGFPHSFKVVRIMESGNAEVQDGRTLRYIPADMLVSAKCNGDLTEEIQPYHMEAR